MKNVIKAGLGRRRWLCERRRGAKAAGLQHHGAAAQLHVTARAVHLRSGKGTSHTSRALLTRGTDFYAECWGRSSGRTWWAYGKVVSGPHNGARGWVSGDHVATDYRN